MTASVIIASTISAMLACDSSTRSGANQPSAPAASTRPNTAVAIPNTWIERWMPMPCQRYRPIGPEKRLDANAPAAIEAVRAPVVIGPPPSSTAPIAGKSAIG